MGIAAEHVRHLQLFEQRSGYDRQLGCSARPAAATGRSRTDERHHGSAFANRCINRWEHGLGLFLHCVGVYVHCLDLLGIAELHHDIGLRRAAGAAILHA
jgi:hypothetical protein